ncbi:MAG: signal peptide peptidase SppA [Planctomycetes bacterium]|nr:signal peptide peptidase SppA [Planctomycetota bacterium]NUQ33557.1 signal peptide peptidase SppA [Planctomycetaceae bacterium]
MHRITLALFFSLALSACSINVTMPLFNNASPVLSESALREGSSSKILVIPLEGTISSHDSRSLLGGSPNTVDGVVRRLNKARDDSSIVAVILKVNSPGGAVAATDSIYSELLRFKRERGIPMIAYFQDVAASGGYYAAMACDHVIAQRTNVCGSIGVFFVHVSVEGLMNDLGVKAQILRTGPMKGDGLPIAPLNKEQLEYRQSMIDEAFDGFIGVVDAGRTNLDEASIRKLADGRVYTASKAKENGLIDAIGTFDDAVTKAGQMAGASDASVVIYSYVSDDVERTIYTDTKTEGGINLGVNLLERLGLDHAGSHLLYLWSPE